MLGSATAVAMIGLGDSVAVVQEYRTGSPAVSRRRCRACVVVVEPRDDDVPRRVGVPRCPPREKVPSPLLRNIRASTQSPLRVTATSSRPSVLKSPAATPVTGGPDARMFCACGERPSPLPSKADTDGYRLAMPDRALTSLFKSPPAIDVRDVDTDLRRLEIHRPAPALGASTASAAAAASVVLPSRAIEPLPPMVVRSARENR